MRAAILQPTFLPWLGWFDIADQVDMLVILDDVAFSKQSWQQRNRLRTPHNLEYITVPVRSAGKHGQMIIDVQIDDLRSATKLERTISSNYSRTPYYKDFSQNFYDAFHKGFQQGYLSKLNIALIEWFFSALGISTPWSMSSEIDVRGKRGLYVAALCESIGAIDYLSPAGAENYLLEDRAPFDQRNISVWLHEYSHPKYQQLYQPFIPYASTLDLIFNEGPRALEIIRSGRCPSRALGISQA
jgi:hypothetical protein